jgi:hypothetical protein
MGRPYYRGQWEYFRVKPFENIQHPVSHFLKQKSRKQFPSFSNIINQPLLIPEVGKVSNAGPPWCNVFRHVKQWRPVLDYTLCT